MLDKWHTQVHHFLKKGPHKKYATKQMLLWKAEHLKKKIILAACVNFYRQLLPVKIIQKWEIPVCVT